MIIARGVGVPPGRLSLSRALKSKRQAVGTGQRNQGPIARSIASGVGIEEQRFWALVERHRPHWRQQRDWLRDHGPELLAFRPHG